MRNLLWMVLALSLSAGAVLSPRWSFLRLNCVPAAQVYDDTYSPQSPGKGLLGSTPVTLPLDRNQTRILWFVRPGYRPERVVLPALPEGAEVPHRLEQSLRLAPADPLSWGWDQVRYHPALAVPSLGLVLLALGLLAYAVRGHLARLERQLRDALLLNPDLVGRRVDDYVVMGKIGEGAYSTVYEVEHTGFRESFAMKLLKPEVSNRVTGERLLRELQLAQRVTHPALVRSMAFGEYQGRPYLVMERVQGITLSQALEARPWSTEELLELLRQAALHRHAIVHRDVKPENLLVDDRGRLRILDLGSAKWLDLSSLTASNTAIGTPLYMSPEHFTSQPLDARSDIYSLGVVAFLALTGRVPFQGEDTTAVWGAHLHLQPPPLRQLRPDLPADLEALVARMLAKSPARRFASMEEVASALSRVQAGLARQGRLP